MEVQITDFLTGEELANHLFEARDASNKLRMETGFHVYHKEGKFALSDVGVGNKYSMKGACYNDTEYLISGWESLLHAHFHSHLGRNLFYAVSDGDLISLTATHSLTGIAWDLNDKKIVMLVLLPQSPSPDYSKKCVKVLKRIENKLGKKKKSVFEAIINTADVLTINDFTNMVLIFSRAPNGSFLSAGKKMEGFDGFIERYILEANQHESRLREEWELAMRAGLEIEVDPKEVERKLKEFNLRLKGGGFSLIP